MIKIVAACVFAVWTAASNATYYKVYLDQRFIGAPIVESIEICPVDDNVHELTVVGFNDSGERGPFSDSAWIQWVFNHDYDGDGIVGWLDFSAFSNAWGTDDPAFDSDGDGIVGFLDFSAFSNAFGTCNDGVIEVPCG